MATTFTKLLMATDFGPETEVALRSCVSLARQLGASVQLLHVASDPMLAVSTPELYAIDWARLRDDVVQQARAALSARATTFADVPVTTEVVVGPPAETIAERAEDLNADLIVMGTHGRSGLSRAFVGSVAERVIRLAPCPVMTVRASGSTQMSLGEAAATTHAGSRP